jgi:biopolymer transport protein ExbD
MAGKTAPQSEKKAARIEIIPLIDVIFFLLATFVLFTLSLSKIVSLPINLPVASASPATKDDNDMVTIQMSDAGTAYWNRELITVADITPRLEQYRKATQNPRVLIAADNKAHFGDTVYALDQVRKAGIDQVSVETRVRPTGQ